MVRRAEAQAPHELPASRACSRSPSRSAWPSSPAYRWLQRRRTNALAAAGLRPPTRAGRLPPAPAAAAVPRRAVPAAARRRPSTSDGRRTAEPSGTVILAFDVSNSMARHGRRADPAGAAQAAAVEFVRAQPDTVDIGVVAFGQGALTTDATDRRARQETIAAINRLARGRRHLAGPGHPRLADRDRRADRSACPEPDSARAAAGPGLLGLGDDRAALRRRGHRRARTRCTPPNWPPTPACTSRPSASARSRAPPSRSTATRWRRR